MDASQKIRLKDLVDEALDGIVPANLSISITSANLDYCQADRQQLQQVVRHLTSRAVRRARAQVAIQIDADPNSVQLVVADDSPCADSPATLLGFSVAREVARRHGGELVRSNDGSRVEMRLPRVA